MARVKFAIDVRAHQERQARFIARTLGTFRAARFLFYREYLLEDALRILLGIRSERLLLPMVQECEVPTLGLDSVIGWNEEIPARRQAKRGFWLTHRDANRGLGTD